MSSVEARLRSALDELFEEVAKLRKEKHEWLKEKEGLQCENQALRNQLRADGAAHRVDGASLMDDEGGSEDEKKEDHSGSLIAYPKGDRVLEGHSDYVYCAVVSTDGRWLFTGSDDKSIIKWNLSYYSLIQQVKAHDHYVFSLAYHPSSLISGSWDHTIRVWNPDNLELVRTLVGHSDDVRSVSVNERGTLIVSGSIDNTIRLWSLMTGECTRVMKGHSNWVTSVGFINDQIISGSWDKSMKVWSVIDASEPRTIKEGIKNGIYDLSINCDGSLVACMFHSGFTVYNWPKLDVMRTVQVRSVYGCFHPCNPDILAVDDYSDYSLRIYLISTGDCIQSFKGHSSYIYDICFTPNGHRLISVSKDKNTRIWDTSALIVKE